MDRFRARTGHFSQMLGGPSGRRGTDDSAAGMKLLLQGDHRPHNRRLSRSGSPSQDQKGLIKQCLDRLNLNRVIGNAEFLFKIANQRIKIRLFLFIMKLMGLSVQKRSDKLFRIILRNGIDAVFFLNKAALFQSLLEHSVKVSFNPCRFLFITLLKTLTQNIAVAPSNTEIHGKRHKQRIKPPWIIRRKAQSHGNLVRCRKAEAVDFINDAVGIFLNLVECLFTIRMRKTDHVAGTDAMDVEKLNQFPHAVFFFGKSLFDDLDLVGTETFDRFENRTVRPDPGEAVLPQCIDDALGGFRTDAFKLNTGKVADDAFPLGRQRPLHGMDFKLHAVAGMFHIYAEKAIDHILLYLGKNAAHRNGLFAGIVDTYLQNGIHRLFVAKDDIDHFTCQFYQFRCFAHAFSRIFCIRSMSFCSTVSMTPPPSISSPR